MTPPAGPAIYSVGHSTHSPERFVELLAANGITAVADVRSSPYSRHNPQFNREALAALLKRHGIAYVFVGRELGARSDDPCCYDDGRVVYGRIARTELFLAGVERVMAGAQTFRVALMCAEKEPLDCHRTLLVARALEGRGARILHILPGGETEPHARTMSRLLDLVGLPHDDMFRTHDELVDAACAIRERKVAYTDESMSEAGDR